MSDSGAEGRELISQMIRGEDAMAPFFTNIDCSNYADFERYLAGQVRQAYDLRFYLEEKGDPDKMLDWTMAKCAVLHEVLLTFRRVMALERGVRLIIVVPTPLPHHIPSPQRIRRSIMAVIVYSKPNCQQCVATKKALERKGIEHSVIDISEDAAAFALVQDLGYRQVPVVVFGDEHWSGFRPDMIEKID